MSTLEPFADAIAFAHDPSQEMRKAHTSAEHDLERTAALASAALSPASSAPSSLSTKLAADALQFCASTKPTQGAVAPGFTTLLRAALDEVRVRVRVRCRGQGERLPS